MNEYLIKYINDPYHDLNNFNLAYEYESIGQTASALSYYLRCAEYTNNDDISYECLLRMSECLGKQDNRKTMELTCIQHALSIKPNRPEANYMISLYYSYRKKWLESYMFACNGIQNINIKYKKFLKKTKYINEYQLYFQKAYSGYHKGKLKESYKIYQDLLHNYQINNFYKGLIENNLNQYPDSIHDKKFNEVVCNEISNQKYLHKKKKINDFSISDNIIYHINDNNNNEVIYNKIGIDIGACIGETLSLFDDYDIIYAIEPSEEEFNILKNKNKNDKRIIPIQCAISDENGESILNCYENCRFSSLLEFNKEGEFYHFCEKNIENFDNLKQRIKVKTIRLDTFFDKYNLNKIDFIKIDTQGNDLKVVKSLGKYIKNIKKIQMEIQLQELYKESSIKEEVIEYMNQNNFQLINTKYGEISKEYEQDFIFENLNEIENKNENIIEDLNENENENEIENKIENIIEDLNENLNENENENKLDIVLQGKYNDKVLFIAEYYLELEFINHIIISCWEDDIIPEYNNQRYLHNDKIIIIKNKIPLQTGSGNKNLQIVSSLNGLKKSTTKFTIKIRNDQKYTHDSMKLMYDFYEKYKEKKCDFYYDNQKPKNRICVSGNFYEFSFHPRDHLFWGNREDLIDLFSLPLEEGNITDEIKFNQPGDYALYYEYFIRSETYIGAHYLSNFDQRINYYLLDPKKYLYDNSEKYYETKELSDQLTPLVFKSFPKEGIDLEWYKYNWETYPYESQRNKFGERWHEDGL